MRATSWMERIPAAAWLRTHLAPSRHTVYFEVRDALEQEGCPLCRLVSRAVHHYLDMLSYEAMNDGWLRPELRAAHGFCRHHAWQFTREFRNGAGRALLYHDILAPLLQTLNSLGPAGSAAGRLLPRSDCPACRSQARATRRYLEVLLLHLPESDFSRHYQSAQGLCLPHLAPALQQARRPADVDLLLEVAARWSAGLRVATRTGLHGPAAAIAAGIAGRAGLLASPAVRPQEDAPEVDAALPEPGAGCPVCRAGVGAAEAFLAGLPAQVRASGPAAGPPIARDLCNTHAWRVFDLLAPGPAARLWQPAAQAVRALLAGPARDGLAGPGPCPACTAQALQERQAMQALLRAGPDGAAAALCLPHAALGLHLSTTTDQRRALIAGQQQAARALRADLAEYLRKQDFHCREARGDEADSPWRAVAHVAAAEHLAAPPLLWEHPQPGR